MNKIIYIAGVTLTIQLILVVVMSLQGGRLDNYDGDRMLLNFDSEKIQHIALQSLEGKKTILKKQGSDWILESLHNAKASDRKIEEMLKKLTELHQGFVVATSPEAAKRFKVSKEQYKSLVTLSADEKTTVEFYVGTSPSFRQLHLRKAGEDEIYSVLLNDYELTPDSEKWLDTEILLLEKERLATLRFPDFSLVQKGESQEWDLQERESGDMTDGDTEKIEDLVRLVASLRPEMVADPVKVDLTLFDSAVELRVSREEGEALIYKIAKSDDNSYLLKRSDLEPYFILSDDIGKKLMETGIGQLMAAKSQEVDGERTGTVQPEKGDMAPMLLPSLQGSSLNLTPPPSEQAE